MLKKRGVYHLVQLDKKKQRNYFNWSHELVLQMNECLIYMWQGMPFRKDIPFRSSRPTYLKWLEMALNEFFWGLSRTLWELNLIHKIVIKMMKCYNMMKSWACKEDIMPHLTPTLCFCPQILPSLGGMASSSLQRWTICLWWLEWPTGRGSTQKNRSKGVSMRCAKAGMTTLTCTITFYIA